MNARIADSLFYISDLIKISYRLFCLCESGSYGVCYRGRCAASVVEGRMRTFNNKMSGFLRRIIPLARPNATLLYASYSTGSREHIDGLVKNKNLVVFMKGTPDAPRCGFSNAVVQILNMHGVDKFEAHNVLEDEDLRQGTRLLLILV